MGLVTTAEMMSEARVMFGNPDQGIYSDDLLLRKLNEAYLLDIVCTYRVPEMDVVVDKTLSANSVTVDLSDVDFVNINGVVRGLPDSYLLEEFNRLDLGKMAGYLIGSNGAPLGAPMFWLWTRDSEDNTATQVRVWPTADQEYLMKLVVTRRPTVLTSGDTTELGDIWDGVLTHFFTSRFANVLGMTSRMQAERAYAKELAAAAGYQVNHASAVWHKISSPTSYGRSE